MTTKNVLLNAIRIDGGTQARTGLDLAVVAEYREVIQAGGTLPPAVVFFDGAETWLAGGFHRYHAYVGEGKASMPCEVRPGTLREAILFACGDNATHGLRRTKDDKRKAVGMLLADAEWTLLSNQQIAKLCAVSHTFVNNQRTALTAPPPVTGGATGTGNVSPPKVAPKAPAAPKEPPAPPPAAEKTEAEKLSEQAAEDAHGGSELSEMLASAEAEAAELREQVKAASADDQKAETMKWQRMCQTAQRRQQELQQVVGDRESELRRHVATLRRIGKAVGEDEEIGMKLAATVEAFVKHAKVSA